MRITPSYIIAIAAKGYRAGSNVAKKLLKIQRQSARIIDVGVVVLPNNSLLLLLLLLLLFF